MLTKAQVKRVVRDTCAQHDKDYDKTFSRDMKWQVFINVCDNLYYGKQITEKQHQSWTNPF